MKILERRKDKRARCASGEVLFWRVGGEILPKGTHWRKIQKKGGEAPKKSFQRTIIADES